MSGSDYEDVDHDHHGDDDHYDHDGRDHDDVDVHVDDLPPQHCCVRL